MTHTFALTVVRKVSPGFVAFFLQLASYILTPRTAASASMSEIRERIIANAPMKRYGNLDELKGANVFLASSAPSYMTGSVLYVDGGFTVW